MPVLSKNELTNLRKELGVRYSILTDALESRELNSANEGAGRRKHWVHPETKCATIANSMQIRLAAEDFKNILAEIKKLK